MSLLTKTAILTVNDLQTEDVEVPESGGAVRGRPSSCATPVRPAYSKASDSPKGQVLRIKHTAREI